MQLIDTHTHLFEDRLCDQLPNVVLRAQQAGVSQSVCIGTDVQTSKRSVEIAQRFSDSIFAAVGIQPNYCHLAKADDWDQIVALAKQDRVCAVGETGLDRYWNECPFDLQQDYFDRHIRLSQETNLPFVVHMRDCLPDVMVMLREGRQRGPLHGVMHSYTGDLTSALECIELGLHISFAGMVTYKNAADIRDVAAKIPADRVLIETDSPYLSPEPKRKQRPNEPALLVHTAACIAEVRNIPFAEFAELTSNNAKQFFRIA
ncbi:MAG: TatD family hydrolase [Planctomycetales bacterium]|nr:TatD family hydrolase [Planctomycetales bacterium]